MKRRIISVATALVATSWAMPGFAANRGSCAADADVISMAVAERVVRNVELTPEFFPSDPSGEKGEYYYTYKQVVTNSIPWKTNTVTATNYVHFYKAKLLRGKEYSVWLADDKGYPLLSTNITVGSIEPEPATGEEVEPGASFDSFSGRWGSMMVLPADSWWIDPEDPEFSDPPSWNYVIRIQGQPGSTADLHYRIGNALPVGIEENPVTLAPALTEKTDGPREFIHGEESFCYSVNFKEGRRYLFATTGGSSNAAYRINMLASGRTFPYDDWACEGNEAIRFDSGEAWSGTLSVSNSAPDGARHEFGIRYRMVPARSITQHDYEEVMPGTAGKSFAPGKLSKYGNEYFDAIVDEGLFAFNAARGEKYVVYTEGAVTNLMMRIYDAQGNVLHENTDCGEVSNYNVRCCFSATKSGRHYIGVCQDLNDYDHETPSYSNVVLRIETLQPRPGVPDRWDCDDDDYLGATTLIPAPATSNDHPVVVNQAVSNDWHQLGLTDWYDVFAINGRKGYGYAIAVTNEDMDIVRNSLSAKLFVMNGTSESSVKSSGSIRPGGTNALKFVATENKTYFLRLSVGAMTGLSHPNYRVHSTVFDTKKGTPPVLGALTVVTRGCDAARWNIDGDASKKVGFCGGTTLMVEPGSYEVRFSEVSGFSTPEPQRVTVVAGQQAETVVGIYNDKYDPKDDDLAQAPTWDVRSASTTCSRTLWTTDPQDGFVFKAKGGLFYNFDLSRNVGPDRTAGDAVFTVCSDVTGTPVTDAAGAPVKDVTSVSRLQLGKGTYYISVHHADDANRRDTYYVLRGSSADVGQIRFAKAAVKVKRGAGIVRLAVKRTAADGRIRVKYGTVAGTAKPGVNYVARTGILEWESGDKTDKTITVPIIPDLFAGDGSVTQFKVRIKGMDDLELVKDEYPAQIALDECTVTVSDSKGKGRDELYAAKKVKTATAKNVSEPLHTGTFTGVLMARVDTVSVRTNAEEFAGILTNGAPQLASLSFTATAADKLSAKVTVAGKKYSLKNGSWGASSNGVRTCTFETPSLKLRVSVTEGESLADWQKAGGWAELTMDVPDVKKGGVQPAIAYAGELFRDNSNVQDYFNALADRFAGYYTVALKTVSAIEYSGGMPLTPAGNGYLGVSIGNKGKAKITGQLPDGTKVSQSANACAIRHELVADGTNGVVETQALYIPLFASKTTYCFGGTLRIYRKPIVVKKPDGTMENLDPDRKDFDTVVDSTTNMVGNLVWNNDDAKLSYEGLSGWQLSMAPVGGWYDTVFNLQAYYKSFAMSLDSPTVADFPSQDLPEGFAFVDTLAAQPGSTEVELAGNTIAVPKKKLVKNAGLVLFDVSENPADLKIKFKRATGIVSGSFTLWAASDEKQKAISGIKHSGIVILQRDSSAILPDDVFSAGFVNYSSKISREIDLNAKTGKYAKRKWTLSLPFNLIETDQSPVNWWADDWGTKE